MQFDGKAWENLEAAERLLPDDDGTRIDSWTNASATRAYYAAYLAAAHRAQQLHVAFTHERKPYYRHDTFPRELAQAGVLDHEGCDALEWLYSVRVKADYQDDNVDIEEAGLAAEMAGRLVRVLLAGGRAA